MSLFSIPPLASSVLFLLLGFFIFFNNQKSRLNFMFCLVCMATAWWQFSWFILFNISDPNLASFIVRIGYIGIIMIPAFFFHFFTVFLDSKKKLDVFFKYAFYLAAVFFELSLITTDFFVQGFYAYPWGFYPKVSFIHPVYILFLTIMVVRSMIILVKSLRANRLQRTLEERNKYLQAKYLLLAFVFYVVASSDFLVNYGVGFYPIGFIFVIIFLLFIAYSVIKTQLMDVKAITTEIFATFLAVVMFIEIFMSASILDLIFRIVIFAITLIISVLLIRSVLREVRRAREIESLNKRLSKTTSDLAEANKALKRLDESKSEFLSISSHQLRTPLTIIKGYSSMLLEGSFGKMSKPVKDSVDKIFVSTERLINLVESLLNISRIEAGRIEFKMEAVDLSAVAKSMVADFQSKAKARKLSLEFAAEGAIPKVAADAQKIKDVVSNIIDNAIKYTKQGEIMVSLHQEGQSVVFSSQDTGIGMDTDDINRLFNKFTRGKDSNKVNTEGTGLGLYYARVLIENMGGRIWVESPGKDKGSKFSFSLPLFDKSKAKKIEA